MPLFNQQLDADGYRPGIGIVLARAGSGVLWARRRRRGGGWQMPQGGLDPGESAEDALYRELHEEVGLRRADVELMACTEDWLSYRVPSRYRWLRGGYVGQRQKWYLLRLLSDESRVRLDATAKPEFDRWRWVSYWYPLRGGVAFKRELYRQALSELAGSYCALPRGGHRE